MTRPTPRQLEILRLLSLGYSRCDVAGKLHMTEHAVRAHLRRAYRRLRVHTVAHAVGECYRRGLFDGERFDPSVPDGPRVLSAAEVVQIVAAYNTGDWSIRELAKANRCSYGGVHRVLTAAGVEFRPRGRPS